MKTIEALAILTKAAAAHANGCALEQVVAINNAIAEVAKLTLAMRPHPARELPDADTTVLLITNDPDDPVWPGFWDGETWRLADASACRARVLAWHHPHDALKLLQP